MTRFDLPSTKRIHYTTKTFERRDHRQRALVIAVHVFCTGIESDVHNLIFIRTRSKADKPSALK